MSWLSLVWLMAMSETPTTETPVVVPPDDQAGQVVMICKVVARGKLDECLIQSESPAGAGFGEMALRASKEMSVRGQVGARVRIPMTFRPPESETSER